MPIRLRHAILALAAGGLLAQGVPAESASWHRPSGAELTESSRLLAKKNKSGSKQRQSSSSSSPSSQPSSEQRRQKSSGDRNRSNEGAGNRSGGDSSGQSGRNREGSSGQRQPKAWKGFNSNKQANPNRSGSRDRSAKRTYNIKNSKIVNVDKRVSKKAVYRGAWGGRRGWVGARPWRYGWYGGWGPRVVVYPGWGWWDAVAPTWGVVSLSPTIVIQEAVDEAVNNDEESIPVNNTDFRVYHASIKPLSGRVIEFNFEHDNELYFAKADCENGLLNDETPAAIEEAELMHSACSIAFNGFGNA
jgi:hypothetical protein